MENFENDFEYFETPHATNSFGLLKIMKKFQPLGDQGANSVVGFMHDKKDKRLPFLVKFIKRSKTSEERINTMFHAQNLCSMFGVSPKIFEVHRSPQYYRIIMEYLPEAMSFRDYLESVDYKIDEDVRTQLRTKINLLGDLKVTHHDLHPDNILVATTGIHQQLFIIDFDDVEFPSDNTPVVDYIESGDYIVVLDKDKIEETKEHFMERFRKLEKNPAMVRTARNLMKSLKVV